MSFVEVKKGSENILVFRTGKIMKIPEPILKVIPKKIIRHSWIEPGIDSPKLWKYKCLDCGSKMHCIGYREFSCQKCFRLIVVGDNSKSIKDSDYQPFAIATVKRCNIDISCANNYLDYLNFHPNGIPIRFDTCYPNQAWCPGCNEAKLTFNCRNGAPANIKCDRCSLTVIIGI